MEDGSVNASGYSIMSPVGSLPRPPSSTASRRGKVAPAATTPTTSASAGGGGDEYLAMSPVSTLTSKAKASPFVPKSAPSASTAAAKANMDIPVRPTTASPQAAAASDKPKDEYMVMSPVNVDPVDIKHRITQEAEEEDEELKNIRRKLEVTPGTPVHLRSGSDMSSTGARPKHTRNSSKRSSFCSDGGGAEGGRWSPPVPWDMQAMDPLGGHLQKQQEAENPEYATMDYTRRPHHHHHHHPSAHSSAASAIPIPSSAHVAGGRMSPASSGSLGVSHGTPNSCMINSGHGRGAGDSDEDDGPVQTFESKARSYLRRDDDDEETHSSAGRSSQASALADSKLPLRAYSISSAARAPSSSSSQGGRSRTSSMSSSKMSAAASRASRLVVPGGGGSGRTPTGQSPIQVFSRIDSWFRSRAGSVPSRQQLSGRRRHRTQSEGEKDSPENQEEAEAAAETKTKTAVSGGSSGGGSAESPNAKG